MHSSNVPSSLTSPSLNPSGTSPRKLRNASTRNSERKDEIGLHLAQELDGNIFEINSTSFFDTFLGGTSGTLEEKCLECLQNPESGFFHKVLGSQLQAEWLAVGSKHPDGESLEVIGQAILKRLPTYDQEQEQFLRLAEPEYEDQMYQPLASLLNFISHFYRIHLGTEDGVDRIDQEWPEATQTWPTVSTESDAASSTESDHSAPVGSPYRRRRFVALSLKPKYIDTRDRDAFRLDMALLLRSSEDPRQPDPLAWKDVKVAIEVKRNFETPHIQTARYARCMKLEQFDRNFMFTLTITGHEFRIARWDSAACYVTPPIDFHKDPLSFIRVVGRLASMTPDELGYDPTFSNAGRVLYSEATERNRGFRTILSVTPCQVSENLQLSPRRALTEIQQPLKYLLDDDLLCDARDLLFCRSTRVWKAQLIANSELSPAYHAIKQNWHDENRINEAWFYEETKDIELGIAHMLYFEDVFRTRDASSRIDPDDVRATWIWPSEKNAVLERREGVSTLGNVCHRVLVRFVLKEVGKPLSELRNPRQLVHVVRDIAVALGVLYDRNILHRDISEGNILLSTNENPALGNRAFLADFGLAMRIDPSTKLPLPGSVKHNHMTGTLPFMATVFHEANGHFTPVSTIHHDVESLFWVALYTVFKCASRERSQTMSEKEHAAVTRCGATLSQLQSSTTVALYYTKKGIMSFGADVKFPGRWLSIRNFLSKVASLCEARFKVALEALELETNPDPKGHDISSIVGEADAIDEDSTVGSGLDALAPSIIAEPRSRTSSLSGSRLRGSSERPTSKSDRSKRARSKYDDDGSYQGRFDGVPVPRGPSKRLRTGASTQGEP
ncbi:hypothetical protein M407DRAFT_25718 [Tulasnella calospora MUT 4182]|uniref:Protein kinase domain-containing protein n=1 Tax=Tulasnella calospora MUT 4182 TaxID=1051891 RepID=A0A0C3QFP9_9AGAM|nr:hypothetical protein M407DRAFT_25718 [Tulasnella calospora MUT 4182]